MSLKSKITRFLRASIQSRMLAVVLPLVIIPLVIVGVVLIFIVNGGIKEESKNFLHERENDLITLSENSSLFNYYLNLEFGLKEEAELYRSEFETSLKNFFARYNRYEKVYKTITYVDSEGGELVKIIDGEISKSYNNAAKKVFFQGVLRSKSLYRSPIQADMIYAIPIYRDKDYDGRLTDEEFRGLIVIDFNYPIKKFRARTITTTLVLITAILLSILLSVLLITALVKRLVKPVRELVKAANSIANGNLSVRIEVATRDEIAQLAVSFNYMAESLKNYIRITIESEKKYRNLFERSKDVVYIASIFGNLIDINSAGMELFGYTSKEEIWDLDITRELYLNSGDWELFRKMLYEDGFVKDFEVQLKRKDGAKLDVLITSNARKDEDGNVIGHEGIIRDVTEKKRLEQELLRSHKMAAISQLVAGVSHEINTPLGAMLSNVRTCTRYHEQIAGLLTTLAGNGNGIAAHHGDLVLKLKVLTAKQLEILQETKDAGQKASGIIMSLKKIYHSGSSSIQINQINVNDELCSVLKLYHQYVDRIRFKQELHATSTVLCYGSELTQVFINIINNAIHAMGEQGEITIRTGEDHSMVKVEIIDTGKGIPPEVLPKIFDPFYTTKQVGEGMGIGLSIVWSIIEKHKGRIYATSVVGKGTTFTIELPKQPSISVTT
jgi:PAS domain S-box-containing protein